MAGLLFIILSASCGGCHCSWHLTRHAKYPKYPSIAASGQHSWRILFSAGVRSATCSASLLSLLIDPCLASFLPNRTLGEGEGEWIFLMTSKKMPREDSKNLSGSSQLGKRKQNIWAEEGILVSDVLILFVQYYCNPQTSIF